MKYPVCTLARVITPGKYIVVSNDIEHVSEVKTLEQRMTKEMKFHDPSEYPLTVKMNVAVIDREGIYRRGFIEKELQQDLYEVLLIDYGVTVQTDKTKLKVITNEDYMKVEPLAFLVILYGLFPVQKVSVDGVEKLRVCREWLPEAQAFAKSVFLSNKKVVVQSTLIQGRIVYGELFLRVKSCKKFMPMRKLLCDNEFCVYSGSNFLKLNNFDPLGGNKTVGYKTKMEFVRKWQKECVPYQAVNHFRLPIPVKQIQQNPEDRFPEKTSQIFSPPESVHKSSPQSPVSSWTEESTSRVLERQERRRKGLELLKEKLLHTKKLRENYEIENAGSLPQTASFHKTEVKVYIGRGRLLKHLNARRLEEKILTSQPPGRMNLGAGSSDTFSGVDETSNSGSQCEVQVARSTSNLEKAVIKVGEFSESKDSEELLELSPSLEDGPRELWKEKPEGLALSREGSCCQDELNKSNADASAESLRFPDESLGSKRKLSRRPSDSKHSVKAMEGWAVEPHTQESRKLFSSAYSCGPYVQFEDSFVEPVNTFMDLPIQPSIIENLGKGGSFRYLSQIQRWAIPVIRKQQNAVVIGSSKTGKTLSFVVPLVDYVQDDSYFEELPEGNGPAVVIVASSSRVCENIYHTCYSLLGNKGKDSPVVILAHGGGREREVWVSLTNGCDILISTPHCLVRLLEMPIITNFERLTTLVLDEIDVLSENPFRSSLRIILEKAQFNTKNRHYQKIICGEQLTPNVKSIMKTYLKSYTLVIGSHSEAVTYGGVKPSIYLVDESRKAEILADKLKDKINKSKILIVCELMTAAIALKDFLAKKEIHAHLAHENILAERLRDIRMIWKCSSHSLLIATDGVLNELNLRDVQTLVHYELPNQWKTNFYLRYYTLDSFLQNNPGFPKARDGSRSAKQHDIIFIDDQNHYQLPHVVDFIVRLGGKVPSQVLEKCKEIRRLIEVNKSDVPICRNLLSFGRCRRSKTCSRRHAFVKSWDSCGSLPTTGWVNFLVLGTHDASSFSARLLQHIDADGSERKLEDRSAELGMKLSEFYKSQSNRRPFGSPKAGDVCAVKTEVDGQEVFYRARIIECLKTDKHKKPLEVNVKLIDQGDFCFRKSIELYELPEELSNYPSTAVDVIVVGVQPTDCDVSWSQIANDFAERLMTQKLEQTQYWSGRIVLSLNNTLFLAPIKRKEFLPHLNTHVFDLVVDRELVNNRIAAENCDHLPQLLKLCGEAGIEISKKGKQRKGKDSTIVQPQWAFFDSDYIQVKFLAAESTSTVFLQPKKFEKLLQELEEDCQKEGEKKAAEIRNRKGKKGYSGSQVTVEMFCLALFEDGRWNRGRVESENENQFYVFFIDHGDFLFIAKQNVVPISETLLLRLPSQAIECKLAGIEENECPLEVLREMYSFSDDGQEYLYARIVSRDLKPAITKGRKYSLNLVDERGISLNKMLVDRGMVRADESERQHLENIDMGECGVDKQEEEEEEEDEDDGEEKSPELNTPLDKTFETYLNNMPDDVFTDEDGQAFLKEFASRFFPACNPSDEATGQDAPSTSNAPEQAGKTSSPEPQHTPTENARRLIQPYRNRKNRNKKVLELKSREDVLTPQVLWCQNHLEIKLKIQLGGVVDYHLECTATNFSFGCLLGEKFYAVDLRLYGAINPRMTKTTVKAFHVLVVLTKLAFPLWPRLHIDPGKFRWISLDVEGVSEEEGTFSEKLSEAKVNIESGLLKKGRRDDDILPCCDTDDSDAPAVISSSDEDDCF